MADDALLERARGSALDGVARLLADVPALFPDALERDDTSVLSRLQILFSQIRDTLVLIDRPATALIAGEALAVLDAVAGNALVQRPASRPEDVVHALLGAHDALLDAVSASAVLLHPGDAEDVATPALSVLNELRSLRGEPFLSHALLIALDIPVDVTGPLQVTGSSVAGGQADALAFAASVRGARPRLMRLLVDWFRAANSERQEAVFVATRGLAMELETLALKAIDAGIARYEQDLLFAAMRVSRAVATGRLDGSGAVRRLFALVERWLVERWSAPGKTAPGEKSSSETDAPGEARVDRSMPELTEQRRRATIGLLRNVLFYVAIAGPDAASAETGTSSTGRSAKAAEALDARYQLDRLRRTALQAMRSQGEARLPTHRMRVDIVARVRAELTPIADWLAQGGITVDDRAIAPRIARLADLPAVFELLGADECRQRLERLRDLLSGDAQSALAHSSRARAARELLHLHEALGRLISNVPRGASADASRGDEEGRALVQRLARVAAPGREGERNESLLEAANVALLAEARRRLADCEIALEGLSGGKATVQATSVAERLSRIARALDIVPRPEASALLDRLCDIVGWLPPRPDEPLKAALARLVVSIHSCLGDATSARTSSRALDDAEQALDAVERELPANRLLDTGAPAPAIGQQIAAVPASALDARAISERALDAFSVIGALLGDDKPAVGMLATEFAALRRLAREIGNDELARLALSAGRRLERIAASDLPGNTDELDPVRDAHIALPQLIERLTLEAGNPSGGLEDIDVLIEALDEPLVEVRSELPEDPLDNTLRGVFVVECTEHLDVLDEELESALSKARDRVIAWTPNERWSRVLHTLTGSARTVDAEVIVALVAPMQRASLARQRAEDAFTRDELGAFADGVTAMREALHAFETDKVAPPFDERLAGKLDALVRVPRIDTRNGSLQEIFAEEAGELLDRLDALADDSIPAQTRRLRVLSLLHTLKGSARVAASSRLADAAHKAEARVAGDDESVSQVALKRLRRELSDCLAIPVVTPIVDGLPAVTRGGSPIAAGLELAPEHLDANANTASSAGTVSKTVDAEVDAASASTRVRDADWERLTELSQDIAASQSRLSAELRRLREASGELDVAAQRWRRLPAAASLLETEAARELLDDLQSVRASLADCLRTVDLEQRRGARAGIALQQDLVRARLVRFDAGGARLQRTLEDAATSVDKRASLLVEGGSITLDSALQARLLPALEHLVRNAVVHGIESVTDRRSRGKDPVGRVRVCASVEGLEFVVRIEDDGGGIDRALGSAAAPGAAGTTFDDQDALFERISAPGFSTLATASGVGGRGLGLGAARERIVELGGRLSMPANDGGGALFEIRVPQRIPVQQVVLVRAGELIAVPVNFIAGIELLSMDESSDVLSTDASGGGSDDGIPRLADLLGTSAQLPATADAVSDPEAAQAQRLLRFAPPVSCESVRVDAVIGYRELVVQPLDVQLASLGRYSGVASLADGQRAFVIDPRELERRGPTPRRLPDARISKRPLALVADDSPTLRAWTRDTLDRLGFETRIVRDGREALDALDELAARPPAVLVLDIDMPRVDGYGVLQTLQRAGEARFPVVVMTSRSSARDREAALDFGAAAFLAKPATTKQLAEVLRRIGLLPAEET